MAMTGGTAYLVNEQYTKSGGHYVRLYLYVKSAQSTQNNQSTLTLGMYVDSEHGIGAWGDSGSYVGTATSGTGCMSFDGAISNGSGVRWLCENKSVTVNHASDGSKTVRLYWKWGVNAYTSFISGYQNPSGYKDVTLPTIPRESTISSASSVNLTASGGVCSVSVGRHSSAFYHKARLTCGGYTSAWSPAFASSGKVTVSGSCLSELSSVTNMSAVLSVQTYTSSACTVTVGSPVTRTVSVRADSTVKPTFAFSVSASNSNATVSSWGIYLKDFSRCVLSVSGATAGKGATLTKCVFTAFGQTKTITGAQSAYSWSPSVVAYGTQTLSATLTDSRGRSTRIIRSITVYDYEKPKITSCTAVRCLSDGTESETGSYLRVMAGRAYSTANGNNAVTLKCKYKAVGGSFSSDTVLTPGTQAVIDANALSSSSYVVRFTVTDTLLGSSYSELTVPTETVCMNLRDGGTGAAFGKYAESDNALELAWSLKLANSAELNASSGAALKTLWYDTAGAQAGDTLSIADIGKFRLFAVRFLDGSGESEMVTPVLCVKYGNVIRGIGGHAYSTGLLFLAVSMTVSGSSVTLDFTTAYATSGSLAQRKICAIYGII